MTAFIPFSIVGSLLDREFRSEEIAVDDYVGNIVMESSKALALLGWRPKAQLSDDLAGRLAFQRERNCAP
jgi:hypothetical protein